MDLKIKGHNGRDITIVETQLCKMAWMQMGSHNEEGIQLCSEPSGDYIGYRQPGTHLTKLAMFANKEDGKMEFQLILSGDEPEAQRVRNFTLLELEEMVRKI